MATCIHASTASSAEAVAGKNLREFLYFWKGVEDQAGERGMDHTRTPFQTEEGTSVLAASAAKEAEEAPQPATGTGLLAPLRLRGGSREVEGLLFV